MNTPFHGGRAVGRAFDGGSDDDEAIARFAEMVADAEAQAPRNGTHKAAEVELLDAAGEAPLLGRISALLSTSCRAAPRPAAVTAASAGRSPRTRGCTGARARRRRSCAFDMR